MTPRVLIVDDDETWLRLMEVELRVYADTFSVITARSGSEALGVLEKNHVAAVVSDLRMPGMDGFELLSCILADYPDVPVFIVTAYDKPKTQDVVSKSGAAGYLKKPFSSEDLAEAIIHTLKKKSEGGSLHNVSLETFLQLIEMEQQTCTLHVEDKRKDRGGVLFFKNGELMNARIGNRHGKDAAYEILSWSKVSLSIEHACAIRENRIKSDLQAILLNAMRSKDENNEPKKPGAAPEPEKTILDGAGRVKRLDGAGGGPKPAAKKSVGAGPGSVKKAPAGASGSAADLSRMSPLDAVRKRLETAIGKRGGIQDIHHDQRWEGLTYQASHVGEALDFGRLTVVYIDKGAEAQYVIVPGKEISVVTVSPDSPRDRIINALL